MIKQTSRDITNTLEKRNVRGGVTKRPEYQHTPLVGVSHMGNMYLMCIPVSNTYCCVT